MAFCERVLGFDCEWVFKAGSRRPVSLLQIATQHGDCALIRVLKLFPNIPDSLKSLLIDKRILKVGVAARDDGIKLLRDFGIEVYGCIDLRFIYKRIRGIFKCKNTGLQGLAKGILGVKMTKDARIRCGNWEALKLSDEQIDYAADDAIIAVDIFTTLVFAKMNGRKPNHTGNEIDVCINDPGYWKVAKSLCQGILDIAYKAKSQIVGEQNGDLTDDHLADHTKQDKTVLDPKSVQPVVKHTRAYVTRKRPLYYNCSLLAPDGQMLCTCDIRKAEWYIMKGLADKVGDEPLTVKLKFEPAGRPSDEFDYYLQNKENICVVCGKNDSYIRKLVVPKEYRRFFPSALKNHSSHDVLLMCVTCHMVSTQYDTVLRNQLADECSAPIDTGSGQKTQQDHDLQKVRAAAKALMNNKDKIPEKRVLELEQAVKDFYGVKNLTEDLLNEAINLDIRIYNQDYLPHGKKVVSHMIKNDGLLKFEKRWRQHFLDTMNPKFMPDKWSVDHNNEHYTDPAQKVMSQTETDCNSDPNKRIVWIVGSSLVYWTQQRAVKQGIPNLDLDSLGVRINWYGIRGNKWEHLISVLEGKSDLPEPEVLVIHLGSKEIAKPNTNDVIQKMKADLVIVKEMFPNTTIMYSEMLSRMRWRGLDVSEAEQKRNLVNQEISDHVTRHGGIAISHPEITNNDLELYRESGVHLSGKGDDIMIKDFSYALKKYFCDRDQVIQSHTS